MAEVTRRLAFYDLRDWWLDQARVQTLLGHDPEDAATDPFFPVAQQPEGSFPYVLYSIKRATGFPQWWMHTEFVGLEIYTFDIEDSTELFNILLDMSGEGAVSARDLNIWVDSEERPRDFEFHSIEFVENETGGDITAPSEEGATHARIATFAIHYSPLHGRSIR